MVYSTIGDDSDWEGLLPPKLGEWLSVFDEEGQTFEEYKKVGLEEEAAFAGHQSTKE